MPAGARPMGVVERMRVGTPPILQLAALDAAMDAWDIADIHDVRARSIDLSEAFIARVEAACPMLTLASPRDPAARGSQVSFRHPEGYAIMQALIAESVIPVAATGQFALRPLIAAEVIDLDEVRHKLDVLDRWCEIEGRAPGQGREAALEVDLERRGDLLEVALEVGPVIQP